MKVLTFSRHFPKGHPNAGAQTHFVEKIWACPEVCILNGDILKIALLNLQRHEYLYTPKGHTIRAGSRYKPGDMVSLRVWSGRPYCSKQIEFAQVEVKKTWDIEISEFWFINGCIMEHDQVMELAKNDGLAYDDFIAWFKIHPNKKGDVFRGQIICWSESIEYNKPYLVTENVNNE